MLARLSRILAAVALSVFLSAMPVTVEATTVYQITPYTIGGVSLTGGTFTTDDTTGTAISLGAILTDYSIDLTDGSSPLTLIPSNSTVFSDSAIFDITATDITYSGTAPNGGFQVRNDSPSNTYHYEVFDIFSFRAMIIRADGTTEQSNFGTAPFLAGTGNIAQVVPEPGTYFLMLIGLGALVTIGYRRQRLAAA